METIKLEDFIIKYWNNPEYEANTFAFGENVVVNKSMLEDDHIHINFVKSYNLPQVWGEVRDDYTHLMIGIQFNFKEVKIFDMGETVFHFKIDLPEEEYL